MILDSIFSFALINKETITLNHTLILYTLMR